jgi:hypothetical protein
MKTNDMSNGNTKYIQNEVSMKNSVKWRRFQVLVRVEQVNDDRLKNMIELWIYLRTRAWVPKSECTTQLPVRYWGI